MYCSWNSEGRSGSCKSYFVFIKCYLFLLALANSNFKGYTHGILVNWKDSPYCSVCASKKIDVYKKYIFILPYIFIFKKIYFYYCLCYLRMCMNICCMLLSLDALELGLQAVWLGPKNWTVLEEQPVFLTAFSPAPLLGVECWLKMWSWAGGMARS